MSLDEPSPRAGEFDHGEEISGGLVIATGDGAESFDVMEEALDAITFSIQAAVETPAISFTGGVAADDDLHGATSDLARQVVGVVARVTDERAPLGMLE